LFEIVIKHEPKQGSIAHDAAESQQQWKERESTESPLNALS